ncbi:MAG TPA: dTDP-glucose 4,6-dehydratase [Candidatus Bipolaricaulota bacterium]|nr:dTDP-glucose 4,6-dehydratase [Candidatus Bipolaricaulota bacterium]
MKLLVTGGAGFIGSNFILYMLSKYPHYEIINYDKLTYAGNLENLKSVENNPNYKFVRGDVLNYELLDLCVKDVDAVVHFAAESHVDKSILGAEEFVRTNVLGTYTLLEVCKNNGNLRFHHVSTDEVFGSLPLESRAAFSEDTPYNPSSPYSSSKAASDHLVRAYYETHKLPITISNCSNNYGPYQFPEKVIPLFVTNLIEEKKVPLYGDGQNVRDWLHVKDHAAAIDSVLHYGRMGETYCVGGNNEVSNIDLTKKILSYMGFGEEMIEYVKDRPGHDRRYAIKPYKIMAELNWRPKYNFEEGLRETIDWYMENKEWWSRVKSGEYQDYYKEWYGKRVNS